MKFKLITRIVSILSFIVGTAGCVMIFKRVELPTMMVTTCGILLIIGSMSDFVTTRKLRKLVYPLIIIYFLVGLPIIEGFTENKVLAIGFALLGCVITIIFIYNDLIISSKEKKLSQQDR